MNRRTKVLLLTIRACAWLAGWRLTSVLSSEPFTVKDVPVGWVAVQGTANAAMISGDYDPRLPVETEWLFLWSGRHKTKVSGP